MSESACLDRKVASTVRQEQPQPSVLFEYAGADQAFAGDCGLELVTDNVLEEKLMHSRVVRVVLAWVEEDGKTKLLDARPERCEFSAVRPAISDQRADGNASATGS